VPHLNNAEKHHHFDPILFTSNMTQAATEWQAIVQLLSQNSFSGGAA